VRDLVFTLMFVLFTIPAIVRPPLALMIWVVMDYMNPHRLCHTWAKLGIPFSMISAAVTVFSLLAAPVPKRFPITRETVLLVLFVIWMSITTVTALNPYVAQWEWDRAVKIQLLVLATLVVVYDRRVLDWLIWTLVGSLGFYGIKGGLFTIMRGGHHRVIGPQYTFIEDNNNLALVLVTIIPLMRYLMLQSSSRLVRHGLGGGMVLIVAAVLGSYSRGGLLALGAMTVFLLMKSRNRLLLGLLLLVSVPAIVQMMPQAWFDRVNSIVYYHEDNSVKGRFNAWAFGWNVAVDRPLVGGGFGVFTKEMFKVYAPDPEDDHEAHNIFVKVLAEHGFVALGLFVLLWFFSWKSAAWVRKVSVHVEELTWARDLASMIQVAMVAFVVGGSALNLSYFGLPYHLMVIAVITKQIVRQTLIQQAAEATRRKDGEEAGGTPVLAYSG
jgi:probable O-glycosylation ligase (exosortase A-associated)